MAPTTIIPLNEFQTQTLLPLEVRAVGTYRVPLRVQGNSLFSSLYVRSLDVGASVEVKYYEQTTGTETGERRDLTSHPVITTAAQTPSTRLITPFHNMPVLEVIVAGGNVEFGVLVTVVATFASDLDSALKLHMQAVNLVNDKGLPNVLYDPTDGKWYFAEGRAGRLVTASELPGVPILRANRLVTTPGASLLLLDLTVPPAKTWKVRQANIICRMHGTYDVLLDAELIGSGRTGPASPNTRFPWVPFIEAPAGGILQVAFTAAAGTAPADVDAYLMATEE